MKSKQQKKVFDFFISASLIKKADLLHHVQKLHFDDGKLIFMNGIVNSYFASVASDFIRHKLLENLNSFTFETVMSFIDKIDFLRTAQYF